MKRGPGSFEGAVAGGGVPVGAAGNGGNGNGGGVPAAAAAAAGGAAAATGPSGGKRPRGDKFEARLLIPSKVAGSIIGKGGANIQKLRSENNANIRVPDCPGPERVMTIHTDSPQIAISVIEQAVPLMSEDTSQQPPPPPSEEGGGAPSQEIRILIHQSVVGGIIGRAGFKIKEIRDQTGANIKVNQTCAPQSSDRCVTVQGSVDKICGALKLIFQVVESTEIKGSNEPYDPNNFDGFFAHEYGGYGSEVDVMGFNGGQQGARSGGGAGRSARGSGGYGGGGGAAAAAGVYAGGRGAAAGGAMRVGYGQDQQFRGGYGAAGRGFGGYRGGGGGRYGGGSDFAGGDAGGAAGFDGSFVGGNFQDGGDGGGGATEQTQVTIPKEVAGAIIGPGGSRIRKIRSDSKATITIDEPLPGSNERIISISGTARSIQTAQYLLQQSVREHSNTGGGRY